MFDPEMRVTPEVQQLLKIICKDPLMFKRIDMGILL